MEHKIIKVLVATVLLISFNACYYDIEEELYPKAQRNNCDSTIGSYSLEVEPLISNQCRSCHNDGFASGGVNLNDYEEVKNATLNGRVLQSIQHASGTSPMPQGSPKLDDCSIKAVELWKNQGAPNN